MQVLIGRLTENAKVNTLTDNRQVVNFSIAMNHSFTPKGGEKRKVTTYAQCSYWIGIGIAEYLTKGTLVEVAGHIGIDAYTNLQGDAKGVLKFHCNYIQLHGSGQQQPTRNANSVSNTQQATEPVDDLPF